MKLLVVIVLLTFSLMGGRGLVSGKIELGSEFTIGIESMGLHRVLGPLKGVVSGLAWVEVFRYQRAFQFEEVDARTRWICALQPHVVEGWDYLSWNLAFNLFAEAGESDAEREKWLRRGLEQLDLGLSLNRGSSRLLYSKAVTLFIRSKDSTVLEMLSLILNEDPVELAADLGVASQMLKKGNYPEATMVVGMLQRASRYEEAIAACDALENRFPNQRKTLHKLKRLFAEEKNADS